MMVLFRASGGTIRAAAAILLVGCALAAGTTPAMAHHSFAAEFDAAKPVTLSGVVTRIEWTNPHARFFIAVTDDTAKTTTWKLELASPKVLVQQCHWTMKSLNIDDHVTVEGALAKDGSTTANARVVTLADGRRVSAGSSGGDVAPRR